MAVADLRKAISSTLQQPPAEYSQRYFAELVRDLQQMIYTQSVPMVWNMGGIIFVPPPNGIPTNGAGFPVGTVYVDTDTLKIVLPNHAYAPTLKIYVHLGTVVATG